MRYLFSGLEEAISPWLSTTQRSLLKEDLERSTISQILKDGQARATSHKGLSKNWLTNRRQAEEGGDGSKLPTSRCSLIISEPLKSRVYYVLYAL